MSCILRAIAILTMTLVAFAPSSFAAGSGHAKEKTKIRRLLVSYKDRVTNAARAKGHFSAGAYVVKSFDMLSNIDVVEIAKGISLEAAQEYYKSDPNVKMVEPDYPVHAFFASPPADGTDPVNPGVDPLYPEQWGLNNLGQTGGIADVDINAPEMWDAGYKGDKNVVIGIIDTGLNYNHPDLQNVIWTNPGEIPGNGIDDDGNNVIDDVHGFNAITGTGDPMDDNGHGSHCAGVIGADSGNTEGGRGVMPNVTIIPCKFLDADGGGETSGAVACLEYFLKLQQSLNYPVQFFATSNSWGGGENSEILEAAIRDHRDAGILFFAAASNEGDDNDQVDTYPADYALSNVVAVAAMDQDDTKAYFSNYGKRSVHLGAPGVDILSTTLGSDYERMSGTSMATPFTAGLAGMIKASDPSLNYLQIKNLLMAGGVPTEALEGITVSGRRIRAVDVGGLGSLTCENQIVSGRLSPPQSSLLIPVGESVTLSAININCAKPNGDIQIQLSGSTESLRLMDDGGDKDDTAQDGLYTRVWTPTEPGRFEFIFPNDDVVVIRVYDPASMQTYVAQDEPAFRYRKFKGTELDAWDDSVSTIDTPFPIMFGGVTEKFDQISISSNGALSFTEFDYVDMTNYELPNQYFTTFIAPYWDDLNPSSGKGRIQYTTLGEAPHREFIVEWKSVRHYHSKNAATFQVVFFENSTDILFNYLDLNMGKNELSNGASATVGIQSTLNNFVQVSYNSPTLSSKKSIRFRLPE